MRIALSLAALALSGHALAASNIEDYTQVTGLISSEDHSNWYERSVLGLSAHGVKALNDQFGLTGSVQWQRTRPCSNPFSNCYNANDYQYDGTLGLVWRQAGIGQLTAKAGRSRDDNRVGFGTDYRHVVATNHVGVGGEYYLGGQGVLGAEIERLNFKQEDWDLLSNPKRHTTIGKVYGEYWQTDTTWRAALSKDDRFHDTQNEFGMTWYGAPRLALGTTFANLNQDYRRVGLDMRYQLPFAKDALTFGTKLEFGREDQRRVEFNLRYDFGPGAKMTLKDRDRNLRY